MENFLHGKRKNVFSLAEIDILRKQIIAKARKYNILGKTFLQIGKSFFISKAMPCHLCNLYDINMEDFVLKDLAICYYLSHFVGKER